MYTISNVEVRKAIRDSGLYAYQVADLIGMSETGFSRLMRNELPEKRKKEILDALKTDKGNQ